MPSASASLPTGASSGWTDDSFRDMVLGWFLAASVRRWGAPAVHVPMADALLAAFGFPQHSALVRRVVRNGLRTRSGVVRLLPEQRRPRLRTEMGRRTYSAWLSTRRPRPAP